jgi:averantin hydroxylase
MRQRNSKFTADKVDQRLRFGATRGDLWDDVINWSDKESGSGMSRQEMISNASAIVVAGSETSATLLSGCTWFLLKNPHHLRKLESHVRSSFNDESEIDLISVGKLDHMLAVLDEALRLYPPVPVQSNRIVTKGGAMIAGQWVPEGVSLMCRAASSMKSSLY